MRQLSKVSSVDRVNVVNVAEVNQGSSVWRVLSAALAPRHHLDGAQARVVMRRLGLIVWSAVVALGATGCKCERGADAESPASSAQPQQEEGKCRDSVDCEVAGQCVTGPVGCTAVHDADCRRSLSCKRHGSCRVRDGQCKAIEKEDCQKSDDCQKSGKCTPQDGGCTAATDADCEASDHCKSLGKCVVTEGSECVATDASCAASELCRKQRACTEDNGRCVARPEDCKKWLCRSIGSCSVNPENGLCYAGSDADCLGSTGCKLHKECVANEGRCVASSEAKAP